MIRSLRLSDIDEIVRIEKETLNSTLGKENFILALDNPLARYYVYILDDKVVGYISTIFDGEILEILNLCVDKNYQKKGIGKAILEYAINDSKKDGAKSVILDVRKDNLIAIHLYESFLFKCIRIRKAYYNDLTDALIYEKKLN